MKKSLSLFAAAGAMALTAAPAAPAANADGPRAEAIANYDPNKQAGGKA